MNENKRVKVLDGYYAGDYGEILKYIEDVGMYEIKLELHGDVEIFNAEDVEIVKNK